MDIRSVCMPKKGSIINVYIDQIISFTITDTTNLTYKKYIGAV